MTIFDWLASPIGVELEHAVIVLILAVSGWITFRTHKQSKENAQLLNGHLEQHMIGTAHTTSGAVVDDTPHM